MQNVLLIEAAAVQIARRSHAQHRRGVGVVRVVVVVDDRIDGAAVRSDVALEAPAASRRSVEKLAVCAGRDSVDGVVAAHQRRYVSLFHALLERHLESTVENEA